MNIRIGFGYDIHRLENGGKLIVGGVVVKEGIHSVAHSDGDVLAHAVIDALLGAVGLADIGKMFPETEENKNMNSMKALEHVKDRISLLGYKVINLDTTVVYSKSKLSSFRDEIKVNLQRILECDVSVKFKSGNGVGDVGKGTAIEAYAMALLSF